MNVSSVIAFSHVICGSIVLVVAPAALAVRKGGTWHRRWGAAFMWGMGGVTATASLMWQPKGHLFLAFLDVISVYLVFSGYRILARRRRSQPDRRADALDFAGALTAIAAGLILIAMGRAATTPLLRSLAAILVVLGAIGATFGGLEAFALRMRPRTQYGWLFYHLSAMLAAYISALTAFIVINAHGVPMLARWLVPGALGTALITGYSIKYRLRFASSKRAAAAAKRAAVLRPQMLAARGPLHGSDAVVKR